MAAAPPPLPLSAPQQQQQQQRPDGSVIHGEVRTIFVLGFPGDVKERELHNMLRFWAGYEASQMNFMYDQPMGFALFSTAALALAARDALQNLVFDAELGPSVLRAEMAKKNLVVKRGVPADPNSSFIDPRKRMRTTGGGDYAPAPCAAPNTAQAMAAAAPAAWGPQIYCTTHPQYAAHAMPQPAPVARPVYVPVQSAKDNPPCNTLFVGKLGETVNENALRALFSQQPGFKQMKVLRQSNNNTVCFIEFLDVHSAISVHANLQGAVLSPSDKGMRIQFSRNPYGRRLRESSINEHQDESVAMAPMVPIMPPGMEANGGMKYIGPSVVYVVPQEQAAV